MLASKKRGRKATLAECEGLLEKIRGVADEVGGAKVLKEFEGKMGGFATVVYQGRAPGVVVKKVASAKKEVVESSVEV